MGPLRSLGVLRRSTAGDPGQPGHERHPLKMQWRLRMAAAERNVWTAADLRRLLASKAHYELSAPSVAALMTREPAQVKLTTLAALCIALDCRPDDLLELDLGQSGLRPRSRTAHVQGQVYGLHTQQPAYRHDATQAPPPQRPRAARIARVGSLPGRRSRADSPCAADRCRMDSASTIWPRATPGGRGAQRRAVQAALPAHDRPDALLGAQLCDPASRAAMSCSLSSSAMKR